jgi:hypothetical protein
MMEQQDLFQSVFGDVPNDTLSKIAMDYPYYSLAHYYLLKNTKTASADYPMIAGKTGLHFNSPFYLNSLLHKPSKNNQLNYQPLTVKEDNPSPAKPVDHPLQTDVVTENTEEMLFEPLHTTDYFASQGIKLGEVKPDDKLGVQLKSFTDWLKSMKKLHDQKLPAGSQQTDLEVQTIAEKSNQEEAVNTESMAEVYISQGKLNKAREIYRKLSLMIPAKSAYFAARIDSLNEK